MPNSPVAPSTWSGTFSTYDPSVEQSSSTPWKKRSGYAGCALILSELLVLLYLMVAAQLSYDSQGNHYHLFIARISLPFLLA